ncbi:proton-coupled amino acid transporter 4 isoform X2 [Cimex lectularius]|nr:proton-coupled amino acid transporter 4 isoform X2 [Cimex lectularius]
MGDVLKNSGILFGPILLITMGIICTYCIHLLLVCANKCAIKWRLPVDPTFAETIELSFKLGPKIFKRTSRLAKSLLVCSLIGTQLGFCSVYYLIIGKAVGRYFQLAGINYDIRIYLSVIYPVILAMVLIRSLKFLAPLSLIANIFILLAVTMVLIVACQDLPNITEREVLRPVERWPFAFGTIIFAYEGINLVIPLRNEMKKPSTFQTLFGVLNVSMTLVILLYTTFGLISYWKYGNDILGNVSTNLPEGHWTTLISDGSLSVALLFSYPLQFHVAFKVIYELLVEKLGAWVETGKRILILEILVRFFLVTLTCLFAMFIPHLSLVISLVGAMCSSWLAILLPVLAHISLYSPWSKNHKENNVIRGSYICKLWFGLFINIICLFVGIAGFILGTYVATVDLISKINEDYIARPPHV